MKTGVVILLFITKLIVDITQHNAICSSPFAIQKQHLAFVYRLMYCDSQNNTEVLK